MTDDLSIRLRALAHSEHSDLSVAEEAADEVDRLRSLVDLMRKVPLYCMTPRGRFGEDECRHYSDSPRCNACLLSEAIQL